MWRVINLSRVSCCCFARLCFRGMIHLYTNLSLKSVKYKKSFLLVVFLPLTWKSEDLGGMWTLGTVIDGSASNDRLPVLELKNLVQLLLWSSIHGGQESAANWWNSCASSFGRKSCSEVRSEIYSLLNVLMGAWVLNFLFSIMGGCCCCKWSSVKGLDKTYVKSL